MKFYMGLLNKLLIAVEFYFIVLTFIRYIIEDKFLFFFLSICMLQVLFVNLEWLIEYNIKESSK